MLLELKNICKSYLDGEKKLTVLEDVSYSFEAGKSYAIVGRSGIGKSTLLNMIAGLDRPTSGDVILDTVSYSNLSEEQLAKLRGATLGFIFQSHHLLAEFNAEENVAMPLIILGQAKSKALLVAREILNKVGLSDRSHHRPSQLSGGEQQRVAIARSMVAKPKMLVADEPTGNLDTTTSWEIVKLLQDINALGTTVIMATHNTDIVNSLLKRVITLNKGVLEKDEKPKGHHEKKESVAEKQETKEEPAKSGEEK